MRIWNLRETAHEEAIKGLMTANPGKYIRLSTKYGYGIYQKKMPQKQVRIIINGGGGYGPMWLGFADEGLADAMVHGNFDSAPNAYVLYEMAKTIEDGCGILFLTNNFMGDYLNNDMALELLERDGIQGKACYVSDDILSCIGEAKEARGGLHGIAQICKIASEAAKQGMNLAEVYRLAEKANERLRSVSVNIQDEKIMFGEGFSGEPAVITGKYFSADQAMKEAYNILLGEMNRWEKDDFYISLNTHYAVGYTETLVLLNSAHQELRKRELHLLGSAAGTYFDVFEGKGFMLGLLACDDELKQYLHPVNGYGFVV